MKSISEIIENSALPDAPLVMPVQVLERKRSLMPRFNWFGLVGRSRVSG